MRPRFRYVTVALTLVVTVAAVSAQLPVRLERPAVAPGEVVRIFAPVAEGEAATARVGWPDGGETVARGVAAADDTVQMLIGVDSSRRPGVARWTVEIVSDDGTMRQQSGTFTVRSRAFGEQAIALNAPLSELRTTEDPRRFEESRILWQLLHTPDPAARYHLGPLALPIGAERRTSAFGLRRVYTYADGETATTIHNGVDIAAPTGTPVVAPGAGRVVMATDRIITGGTVVIEHVAGVFSLFYHFDEIGVEAGELVATGDPIGTVGATGLATGPHLHWEVRVAGAAVDPDLLTTVPLVDTEAPARDTPSDSDEERG